MTLAPGQKLSHYEILGPLGAGAMGEVWRARDTRLEREVAIKVLPEELAGDEDRLRRFEREAKTIASLNHPNVAGIHGVDLVGDTCFLALELVPGEDLAERLLRGALPTDEAIAVCRQIAEGMEAAHEAGVVHRDLKPANVRITPDGVVKLLDFGLAKPARPSAAGSGQGGLPGLHTEAGIVLGTPMYMSPEQARGKPVDRRTDIWAFGCVLYECLAGRRVFAGDTKSDVLAAVLGNAPDLSRLPATTPTGVSRLVARCLDKDPRTRLQDMGEARIGLAPGVDAEDVDVTSSRKALPLLATLLTGFAVGVAVAVFAWRSEGPSTGPLDGATFHRLTGFAGNELDPAISPHGDFVSYLSDRDGTTDVFVAQIEGGEPINLTQGRHGIRNDYIRNSGFSAGATHVWFHQEPEVRLMAAPKTGGSWEPFMGPQVINMDWTRDGSRVAYHTREAGDPIYVRAVDDPQGESVRAGQPGMHQHFPTWSTDEEWIYLVRGQDVPIDMDLWRMRPDGTQAEQLTRDLKHVSFPTPLDSDTVLFIAKDALGAGPWIWSLDLPTRVVRRLTIGTERYTTLAASDDGRRLVAAVMNPKAALWRVPLGTEIASEQDVEPMPGVPSLYALAPSFEGDELFYLSSRGSTESLWSLRGGRAREIWSGLKERTIYLPSVSPDGRRVAVARHRGERWAMFVVDVGSGQTLHVFEDPIDVRGGSSWSPDGAWIVAGGVGPDGPGLFRFPSDGGPAEMLVRGGAVNPAWSPAGDVIAYCGEQVGPYLPLRAVRDDGTPVTLGDGSLKVRVQGTRLRFVPDGSGLVYMAHTRPTVDFRHLDLETGQVRQLTGLEDRGTIQSFDITPDGRYLVFDRVQENSDVVLIERPERDPY